MKRSNGPRPGVKAPFTQQSVEEWNKALMQCEQAREMCELGVQAGIPCEEMLSQCQAVRDQLTKLKQVFAPGVP